MSVAEAQHRISSREYVEWLAYYTIKNEQQSAAADGHQHIDFNDTAQFDAFFSNK